MVTFFLAALNAVAANIFSANTEIANESAAAFVVEAAVLVCLEVKTGRSAVALLSTAIVIRVFTRGDGRTGSVVIVCAG